MTPKKRADQLADLDARIDQDLEYERPWRARQRLGTWIHQFPERADHWRVRLGELHLAIHEDEEAGRLFCEANSHAPEHQDAIAFFLERLPPARPLHRALARPLADYRDSGAALPEGAMRVTEARDAAVDDLAAKAAAPWAKRQQRSGSGAVGALLNFGCALALIVGLIALVLGMREIAEMIRSLFE